MSIKQLSLSLIAVLAVAAPGSGAAASPDRPAPSLLALVDGMPPDQPTTPGQPSPPTQTTPTQPVVTDVEIFAVLETITDTSIDHAREAQKTASDRRVKKFAESIVKRNTAAKRRQASLRTRHNLQAAAGQTSESFQREAEQTFSDMRGLEKGGAYDRAFIDNNVELLSNAIGYINNRLLPNVQLPALRTELQTVVGQLETDLKSAQKLQSQLTEKTS